MQYPRVRLLYPSGVTREEVASAVRGMERFNRFGVLCDTAGLDIGRKALRGVRNGASIRRCIEAGSVVSCAEIRGSVSEIFFRKDIIPLGITGLQMLKRDDDPYSDNTGPVIGVAREYEGAVVSLSRIRTLEGGSGSALGMEAVETAVAHELGHVFGRDGHCETNGCIMQANDDFADFIERFVKAGADFCRDCSSRISVAVGRMSYPY